MALQPGNLLRMQLDGRKVSSFLGKRDLDIKLEQKTAYLENMIHNKTTQKTESTEKVS
jgi:hypothetical protein